jgi:hypothetical protein
MIKYYVNKDNGTVVAKITGTKNSALIYIRNKYGALKSNEYKRYMIPDAFIGKAKCNFDDGDKFNVEYGKELARGRLIDKVHHATNIRIAKYLNDQIAKLQKDVPNFTDE